MPFRSHFFTIYKNYKNGAGQIGAKQAAAQPVG
jgi:hypothetical protein